MARTSMATLQAEIARLTALIEARPTAPSAASSHWQEQDIPCSAAKPCEKTFRTAKGRDWHVANVKH